jgi:hypothetical protein
MGTYVLANLAKHLYYDPYQQLGGGSMEEELEKLSLRIIEEKSVPLSLQEIKEIITRLTDDLL